MFEHSRSWSLRFCRLDHEVSTERLFRELFAASADAFWLDSSLVEPGLSRFSFLGDCSGPYGEILTYDVATGTVEVRQGSGPATLITGSIFDALEERLSARAMDSYPELPFDLTCGYVGYLGYEVKADCGSPNRHVAPTPDAIWMAATRIAVVDHLEKKTWLVALCGPDQEGKDATERWLAGARAQVSSLPIYEQSANGRTVTGVQFDPEPWLVRSRGTYVADIEHCREQLCAGESYEICLTNTIEFAFNGDPLELYLRQRQTNPAPYAGYLRLAGLDVLCSSPERFLKVTRDGIVESKPIKGTAPRHADSIADAAARDELAASTKNQAENLMIVDLLRNDLGRVCEVGTVSVPRLMAVESYATVHQLVSTVRGRLREDMSPVDAVRACFPGGSMTGAPKLRTMEIIDAIETRARGIYSGVIGYFGLGGTADLNIVIRTIVLDGKRLTVGAGGAIVLDSDPDEEFEEMLLKARAPLRALRYRAPDEQSIDAATPP
jgi:para-aminobenzoate synthetase